MSKELRKFSRSYAREPRLLAKFFDEIKTDSARGSVAAISALIEEQLADAIKARLVSLTEKEEDELFQNNGPLATLSSRIKFGYALGLYGKKARRDLDLVREIRNAFIHLRQHIDYETPEVKKLCATFYCAPLIPDFLKQTSREQFREAAIRAACFATRHMFGRAFGQMVEQYVEYQEDVEELKKKGVDLPFIEQRLPMRLSKTSTLRAWISPSHFYAKKDVLALIGKSTIPHRTGLCTVVPLP